MKNIRVIIFLCIYIIILLFPGCSLSQEEKENIEKTSQKPQISIMLKMSDSFSSDNNSYLKYLEDKLNIDIEIETPSPSSYNERLNVIMAVNDFPDIIQLNWTGEGNFSKWVQEGLIQPIDLSKAENIEMNVPEALLTMMKVGNDDEVYAVPGITTSYPYGVVIRKDWLEALNLEHPKTLEEFENVLYQFTYADPDGNGKNDTYGITSYRLNHIGGVFAGAFKTDYLWGSIHKDVGSEEGEVNLKENQRGYLDFLRFIKGLYEKGLVDPSFISLQNAEDKFSLGKIGLIGAYSNNVIEIENDLKNSVPEAEVEWLLLPGDDEGKIWNFIPESYGYNGAGSMFGDNAIFMITKSADYDVALEFLDAMNSQEMMLFSNLGIEGIHYQKFDSNRNIIVRTAEQYETVNRELFGFSDTYRGVSYTYTGKNEEENNRLEYYRKKGYLLITNPHSYNTGLVTEVGEFQKNYPKYKEYERHLSIQYIMGDITLEDYLEIVENELYVQKLELTETINEKYYDLISDLILK